jgi:hypothetical protein
MVIGRTSLVVESTISPMFTDLPSSRPLRLRYCGEYRFPRGGNPLLTGKEKSPGIVAFPRDPPIGCACPKHLFKGEVSLLAMNAQRNEGLSL